MSQFRPVDARNPLGKCLALNTDGDMPLQSAWDKKQAFQAQARQQEDARIIQALEHACNAHECGWRKCDAILGSWELLRKHMERIHCEALSPTQASSSRPYRCRYATCQNRVFSVAPLLLEHVVSSHLEQLKLRCPFGCKQAPTRLQSLVQHLSSVHDTTPFELPRVELRRPSPQRGPLPELPTHAPTYLVSALQVIPSPSFDPSNVLVVETSEDEWKDFAGIDKPNAALRPFKRLQLPKAVDMPTVRKIPREHEETCDDEVPEDSEESV